MFHWGPLMVLLSLFRLGSITSLGIETRLKLHAPVQSPSALKPFLQHDDIINWDDPTVLQLAKALKGPDDFATIKSCFEWVRDEVQHCFDYRVDPVTCRASDVLLHKTGFCYSKSHLLAALLRANDIPTGFCYQRLCIGDSVPQGPYCLHGFNAVYLSSTGSNGYWFRLDPRGNNHRVSTQFTPPVEKLAYGATLEGERNFDVVFAEPLPQVVQALFDFSTCDALIQNLPDCTTI